MLNSIGIDITDYYKPQLSASAPKNWMSNISKISNTPKLPMGKSADSFWGGLKAGTSKFMGKAGDEMKWLNQDMTSGLSGLADLAGKAGKGLGVGNMIDMGAGIVDSVAGAVGLEGAEVTTGLDNALDTVASLPLEFIPGFGTIAKGGLKALSLINKYGGKKSKQQGTDYGLATLGYDKEFNPLSNKKYGLFSRKSRRRTNKLTAQQDKANLMKSVPGFNETQNVYASQNTTASLTDKNYQQMMGGADTRMLAARMGTKIPPVNLRKIANKAVYSFEQKNKFKDPILGKENFEEYRKRIGKLNPSFLKDDPYYNLLGAFEGGLEPELNEEDGTYHLGSRNPKTGEILKRPGHPTWDLMLKGEEEAGYEVYQEGDKWFSREKKKYKDGGLLTKADKKEVIEEVVEEKKNVIPEGAFHSRLNKIDEGVSEHVTRKGIPVITKDEEGKITQHAEVERNEIIFHKEATDTIESLHEKYKKAETQKLKDEIMIECGKYVADQILVNTDDRTGIIETIE